MTTAEQAHPLDPYLSRRDLGIVDDFVAYALEQVRAGHSLTWDEAVAYIRAHPAVSGDKAPTIAVVAVNRLEETGEIVYDRNNDLRLRRDGDPTFAADPLTIKRAVVDYMSAGHTSSVWKLYAEAFKGRYVHWDVYYACRALLDAGLLAKPNAQGALLRYVAPVTTSRVEVPAAESGAVTFEQQLAADVAQLDAELEAVEEQLDDETDETIETVLRRKARQIEALLRDRYASHRRIPHDDVEYEVASGGRIDVLDRARSRVVEAKLDVGLTSVCQAVGQAEGYLFALRRFEGVAVDRVAVLLPKRPGLFVLEYLGAIVAAGRPVGLVYLEGDRFVEHSFATSMPTAAVRA